MLQRSDLNEFAPETMKKDAGYASTVLARLESLDVFVYNETIRKFSGSKGSYFEALLAFKVVLIDEAFELEGDLDIAVALSG
ncbi:hypothetical protein QQ045_020433 [Rhodiola kirilowii]